jgi:hypothetical protein
MALDKIFLPTFISSVNYEPTRVLPHVYFYNGMKDTNTYYVEYLNSGSVLTSGLSAFPYFDNYQGNNPTTSSRTLLFNNETAPYGEIPTESLYSEYWEKYVTLLYAPTTRLFDCEAIIPLADYFKMELNDIVEWRGNYYHLRAINDYNLSNGECQLQLLGPVIGDVIANTIPGIGCNFDYTLSTAPPDYITITLTDEGANSGPTYAVYTSPDGVNFTFLQNVTLANVGDTTTILFPESAVVCKLVNINAICSNSIVHVIPGSLAGDFSFDFSQLDFN